MAFVSLAATLHVSMAAANVFTATVPAEHTGRLQSIDIREGVDIKRQGLPPRPTTLTAVILDDLDLYQSRKILPDALVIVMLSQDGAVATEFFRGVVDKATPRKASETKVAVRVRAFGLLNDLRQRKVSGGNANDWVLDDAIIKRLNDAEWPDTLQDVPDMPEDVTLSIWGLAEDASPLAEITDLIGAAGPPAVFNVERDGTARVSWDDGMTTVFQEREFLTDTKELESAEHLYNQVVLQSAELEQMPVGDGRTLLYGDTTQRTIVDQIDGNLNQVITYYEITISGRTGTRPLTLEYDRPPTPAGIIYAFIALYPASGDGIVRIGAWFEAPGQGLSSQIRGTRVYQIDETVVTTIIAATNEETFNLNEVEPATPRQYTSPLVGFDSDYRETLADKIFEAYGEPPRFWTGQIRANNSDRVDRVLGLKLGNVVRVGTLPSGILGRVADIRWRFSQTLLTVEPTLWVVKPVLGQVMNLALSSSGDSITALWDAVTNAGYYQLEYREEGATDWIQLPIDATTHTVTGLP